MQIGEGARMVIDQDEIEALLKQSNCLVEDVASEPAAPPHMAGPSGAPPQSSGSDASPNEALASPDLARILKISVPVIVRIARRRMPIRAIRSLSAGAIVEFDTHVDEPLDLLINNRCIGQGHAVKVGENFGLRIGAINDAVQRIKSMGR